ncbi:DNA-binding response regulator [Rubrivivax gelatinosus]|uniref:DNA-binding response regulator n=1 Tax=Rubrivivax gelatinosus TaxID=28068 RepID=A0ABS1DWS1_RUBGE|nr:response regulator transcription factor [Rubrivivax gelatinosus]MBK1614280.1 DNA-binding response regulator [Rubrivivax gelatinosus]MBK1713430.1 DNA-binding response regulator [Rubrivivax gelatinosus]
MKVLLVDDHPLILSALQAVIRGLGDDVTVLGVASAEAAREALRLDAEHDLVLLDLALGDADGFEVLAEFRATYPELPVVVVSASERASDVIRAIDLGAMGFVPKRSSNKALCEALRMVMSGGLYVPPNMLGLEARPAADAPDTVPGALRLLADAPLGERARPEPHQEPPSMARLGLTPRQGEVLGLLLKGLPNKLIARELELSVETVKDHVAAVLRALGVSTRTQAVLAVSQMMQRQAGYAPKTPPQP